MAYGRRNRIAKEHGGVYPDIVTDMYMDGKTVLEICEIFNSSRGGIMRHLRDSGLYKSERRILTREEIIEIYNCNLPLYKAKEKFKIGATTFYEIKTGFYKGRDVCNGLVRKKEKLKAQTKKTEYVECLKCGKKNIKKVHRDNQTRICKYCTKLNNGRSATEYYKRPRI